MMQRSTALGCCFSTVYEEYLLYPILYTKEAFLATAALLLLQAIQRPNMGKR